MGDDGEEVEARVEAVDTAEAAADAAAAGPAVDLGREGVLADPAKGICATFS